MTLVFCKDRHCNGSDIPAPYAIGGDGLCDVCRWRANQPKPETLLERIKAKLGL